MQPPCQPIPVGRAKGWVGGCWDGYSLTAGSVFVLVVLGCLLLPVKTKRQGKQIFLRGINSFLKGHESLFFFFSRVLGREGGKLDTLLRGQQEGMGDGV